MLSSIIHGRTYCLDLRLLFMTDANEQEGHHNAGPVKPAIQDPVVQEIIPSPELERANPIEPPVEALSVHTNGLTLTQSLSPRPTLNPAGTFFDFVSHVKQQHLVIKQRSQNELGADVPRYIFDQSYIGLLEWIRHERMTQLPHKGGMWDAVLIKSHYFADQIESFRKLLVGFVPEVSSASSMIFGHCMLLLELGHENAAALDKAFGLFYQFGLELSVLLRSNSLFRAGKTIEAHLGRILVDLMSIVTGIAINFYMAVHGKKAEATVDVYRTFSASIEAFRSHRKQAAAEMWSRALSRAGIDDEECEVAALQRWLAPKDSVLAFLASNHVSLTSRRAEFTCQWFTPHLANFLRGNKNILSVEGESGSGKTTLAGWIVDRLQRPLARQTYSTLSFSVSQSNIAQSTSLSLVKTLLYQLTEQRIGDIIVYRALKSAFTETRSKAQRTGYEDRLWKAFEDAVRSVQLFDGAAHNKTITVLVIDGLDEIANQRPSGKVAAQNVCNRLHRIAQSHSNIRLIRLSTPLGLASADMSLVQITAEQNGEDIRAIVRQSMMKLDHFADRGHVEQEALIERVSSAADDNMLFAALACEYLSYQTSHNALTDAIASVEACKPEEMLHRLLSVIKFTPESRVLLSALVAANRPMTAAELALLMRVRTDNGTVTTGFIDVNPVVKSLGPLLIRNEGLVGLRHESLRAQLIMLPAQNKFGISLTHRHKELATRLFIYMKTALNEQYEVSFDALELHASTHLYNANKLLEYSVRYWFAHFKRSTAWYKSAGAFEGLDELRKLFPSSVALAVLERSSWSFDTEGFEAHKEAFRLRNALFDDKSMCRLQSALSCAVIAEALSFHSECASFYIRAVKIAQVVLSAQASVTVACAIAFLRISESMVSKQRCEIMTWREETMLVLISAYKHIHGASSLVVLEWYKKLAALYVFIMEEKRAAEIYVIIRQITIHIHGEHSEEAQKLKGELSVTLKHHEHHEIDKFTGSIFANYGVSEEVVVWDITRVELYIRLAAKLVLRGEFKLAEERYIELWLQIGQSCGHGLVWHEKKITVLLAYARMLFNCKRVVEAHSVLICIWREYQHHEHSNTLAIVLLLKEVAFFMKTASLFELSLSILRKVHSFFSQHSEYHEKYEFKSLEEEITTVTRKVVETRTSTSTTEMVSMFEEMISSSTEISETIIKTCESLTLTLVKEERYSEAVSILKLCVTKAWSSFFWSSSESLVLCAKFQSEVIEFVSRLAFCYIQIGRLEKAEEMYFRLFVSIRASKRCDDALFIRFSEVLIAFYKQHTWTSKLISFYQGLLISYRSFYGETHAMTIKLLYTLGSICRAHYRTHGYWLDYYLAILVLNRGQEVCHADSLEALLIVAQYYYEDNRWSECLSFYKQLALTFFKIGTTYKFFQVSVVMQIFKAYLFAFQKSCIDIEIQVSIFRSYREACIKYFGVTASITIEATFQLCSIYESSEKYLESAMSLYLELKKVEVSVEIRQRIETSIKRVYTKKTSMKHSSKTVITREETETVTSIVRKSYEERREKYGYTHIEVRSEFSQLISLYMKLEKSEVVLTEMRSYLVAIFASKSVESREMVESARFLADIYRSCGFLQRGVEILHELQLQIIFKSTLHIGHCGFDLTKYSREWLVFIASFKAALYLELSFDACLIDVLAEALYYDRFISAVTAAVDFKVVLFAAAHLRAFLIERKRTAYFVTMEALVAASFRQLNHKILNGCSDAAVSSFVSAILIYFSTHLSAKNVVYSAGYAAVERMRVLIKENNHKAAYELATCTYRYLMGREGLDDPSELGLGFQLALLLAGRGYSAPQDAALRNAMLDLSRKVLTEVLDICEKAKISLASLNLEDLNEIICLMGDQKDYRKLQSLLTKLWSSREAQSSWSEETKLSLARRLIETHFVAGDRAAALRLCEDIVYNVRRVHGSRHTHTLSFVALLGRLYTSTALHYASHPATDKNAHALAKTYLRKAMGVQEAALKDCVEVRGGAESDDDEDLDSEIGSATGTPPAAGALSGSAQVAVSMEYVRLHLLLLKRAFQRLGGWAKDAREYDQVTVSVWDRYGSDLKLGKDNVLAAHWNAKMFGNGKAEGDEDLFTAPKGWSIVSVKS